MAAEGRITNELPMNYHYLGYHPSDLVADLAGFC
jgi:hypothetical protein